MRSRSYFYATLGIIAVNLFVYLLVELDPTLHGVFALIPGETLGGAWWQPLTYMYDHAGFNHLLFNMLGLFFFGTAVEEELGSTEFLIFYHVTGVAAGLASLALYVTLGQGNLILVGASGAVFAVTLAFAAFRPNAVILLFFVLPLRARSLVILYAAFEVGSQLIDPYGGVAHLTHLAGYAFAWLYLLLRLRVDPWKAFWR